MATNTAPSYTNMAKNMADELEKRQRDWQKEIERMQQDFFKTVKVNDSAEKRDVPLSPTASSSSLPSSPSAVQYTNRDVIAADGIQRLPDGTAVFRARFDIRDFNPDEVSVRVVRVDEDDGGGGVASNKLVVSARHVEAAGRPPSQSTNYDERRLSSVSSPDGCRRSREFNRRVSLPPSVDLDRLVSRLAYDGLLTVEAPLLQGPTVVDAFPSPPRYESLLSASPPSVYGHRDAVAPRSANTRDRRDSRSSASALESYPSADVTFGDTPGGAVVELDDYQLLKLTVDLGSADFSPEDVRVVLVHANRKLSVVARHETTSSTTGKTTRRQFSRELDVNESIDPRTLAVALDTDVGRLTVVAVIGRVTSSTLPLSRQFERYGSADATVAKILRSSGRPSAMKPCAVELR